MPNQHLSRPRAPTQWQTRAPPHGDCASLHDRLASTWQEWLQMRASVTSSPKPDVGRAHKLVFVPTCSCQGSRKACRARALASSSPLRGQPRSTPARPSFLQPRIHSVDSRCDAVWPRAGLLSSLACDGSHIAGGAWPSRLVRQGSLGGVWVGGRKPRVGAAQPPQHSQWQRQGWLFTGLPGEFWNLALAHALQREAVLPSSSLPFLRAPENPSPH